MNVEGDVEHLEVDIKHSSFHDKGHVDLALIVFIVLSNALMSHEFG